MKRMLVTGATSGIGEALVKLAANKDYRVIACGRNGEKLNTLSTIQNVSALKFDVSDQQQTLNALRHTSADIYVLNAGVCEYVEIDTFDPAMFRRVFEANFFGVVNCIDALLPQLVTGNQLVIVDSMARLLPFTQSQAYGASKAALHYLTKTMEVDLASRGIIVQSVSPGFVATPLTNKNDFDMPMRISVDEAVASLLHGIEKHTSSIFFPTIFGMLLRTLYRLPSSLKVALSKRMKNNKQDVN
ncbi:SDR family NAD(P)-dependent oxidoreductase [Paraglaciecola polaris]|uniref:Short chain dehydrogenase family protein n=1 Tax=Paraglaciecola polaris LMG 21857 TaxID=1129793 RepID=K6ZHG7_9ALTE|nr:SDR family NAD(P)-dependent oxidoreductase [Paraglaciecola polaris]GAC35466.1 short chain dehydrogenase family protein [Paraglaciecola polaris LMG 21857]|tara:strand:- start:3866 stop:4597 length:732 start_codon:yes stop_codon:yes gene_type:complete